MFHIPDSNFPFQELLWNKPVSILGEPNHFVIKSYLGNKSTPVYFQTPICQLKDGSFTKVGKNTYIDFVFSNDNNLEFLEWMKSLEDICQKQLNLHQNEWFESKFTEEDINNLFISPFKNTRSKTVSVRTNLPISQTIKIFNEDKHEIEYTDPFHTEEKVIAIIELVGIKCSPRNFHIDFEVKQMMLLKPEKPIFSSCLISSPLVTSLSSTPLEPLKPVGLEELEEPEEPLKPVELEEPLELVQPLEPLELEEILAIVDEEKEKEKVKEKEPDPWDQAYEKAKTARHLGIMEFLKSRNYKFNEENLIF